MVERRLRRLEDEAGVADYTSRPLEDLSREEVEARIRRLQLESESMDR